MIVRILDNSIEAIGLRTDLSLSPGYDTEKEDKPYNVTNYLILPHVNAININEELQHKNLDVNTCTYGIYVMDEEDVAMWLLRL